MATAILDFDCIRDILIYLSEHIGYVFDNIYFQTVDWKDVVNALTEENKYEPSVVQYNLLQLREEGFIKASKFQQVMNGKITRFIIDDITWKGHNLLTNIQNDTLWNKVKNVLKSIGGLGITVVANVLTTQGEALLTGMLIGK